MNKPDLVHPNLMESLKDKFLTGECDIQEFSESYGTYNDLSKSWTDKFTDIECAVSKDNSQEKRENDKTVRQSTHRFILDDVYDVKEYDRVKFENEFFDIMAVEKGMTGTKTSLVVEKREV